MKEEMEEEEGVVLFVHFIRVQIPHAINECAGSDSVWALDCGSLLVCVLQR